MIQMDPNISREPLPRTRAWGLWDDIPREWPDVGSKWMEFLEIFDGHVDFLCIFYGISGFLGIFYKVSDFRRILSWVCGL